MAHCARHSMLAKRRRAVKPRQIGSSGEYERKKRGGTNLPAQAAGWIGLIASLIRLVRTLLEGKHS